MNSSGKKSKGKGAGGVFAVLLLVMALNFIAGGEYDAVIPIILIAAVIAAVVFLPKALKKKDGSAGSVKNEEAAVTDKVYVPLHEEPAKQYYDSSDVFDNSVRDRERRIQQLKVFLKNGLIDKDEYNVLLYRYENDI